MQLRALAGVPFWWNSLLDRLLLISPLVSGAPARMHHKQASAPKP